jgi:endonuclease/exonuclease/phosphatase family metal-dependent hydrolase
MGRTLAVTAATVLTGCSALHHAPSAPPTVAACRSTVPPGASLRWITSDRRSDRLRLDAWCAGVGPPLIRLQANSSRTNEHVNAADVVVVSWNVHVGLGDIGRFISDLRSGKIVNGRPVRHFVLLLEEAVRSRGVPAVVAANARAAPWIGASRATSSYVDDLAARLDLSLIYVPSMRNGFAPEHGEPSDRGNAIISTMPLSDPFAVELPGARQRRVAVGASVSVDFDGQATAIRVGAAHFNVLGPARTLWIFGATTSRARQAQSLVQAWPEGPGVLGADVNSWQGSEEPSVRRLRRAFPATPSSRVSSFRTGFALDRLFFRLPPGWRAHISRAASRYGADHYPILGSFSN